nr:immunoglobulin light chain junction region [Macaca mulatta]
SMQKTHIPPTF